MRRHLTTLSDTMTNPLRLATCLLAVLLTLHGVSVAQEEDPADALAAEAEPQDAAADPDADAFGAPAADPAGQPAPGAAVEIPDDLAVRALLETNPSTPGELLQAVRILVDLGYPLTAKPLMDRLAALSLDDVALTDLAEEYGPSTLLTLARTPELAPQGKQFADKALAAASSAARNPAHLQRRIGQLSDPSLEVRGTALADLQDAREAGLSAVVAALVDPNNAARRPALRDALASWRPSAVDAVTSALAVQDPAAQVAVIQTLGRLDQPAVSTRLWAPALAPSSPAEVRRAARRALDELTGGTPEPEQAAAILFSRARDALAQTDGLANSPPVATWRWDAMANRPVLETLPAADARRQRALADALAAHDILPQSKSLSRLALVARLESLSAAQSAPAPLPAELTAELDALGINGLLSLLTESADAGNIQAALAIARRLADLGRIEAVILPAGQISPLVEATRHPDRRLRFAALEAIVKLQPHRPFAGASHVLEALEFFISAAGAPVVLIASPRSEEVGRLSGLIGGLGYEVIGVTDDRELLAVAIHTPDAELCLIDYPLAFPTSGQLLQQLRRDARTRRLPIGILTGVAQGSLAGLATDNEYAYAERLARRSEGVVPLVRPHDAAGAKFQIDKLLALTSRERVAADVRLAQAKTALGWLADLAATPHDPYEAGRLVSQAIDALYVPELFPQAAAVLSRIGTRQSQRALVDMASGGVFPFPTRQAAVDALAESLANHGTLLASAEIDLQFERYNLTETQSRENQELMSKILDLIEAGRPAATP